MTRAGGDGTRGDGFGLTEGRFRSDLRKEFFTLRVGKPQPKLPREVGDAPSSGTSQARLDWAGSTGWRCPCHGRGLGWVASEGPCSPKPFGDSMIHVLSARGASGGHQCSLGHETGAMGLNWETEKGFCRIPAT